KLPAALACGVPVVVSAGGDVADLVASTGVGLHCPAEDWRALAGRLADAAAMPPQRRLALGRRARAVYEESMSLRAGVDQIEEMLVKMSLGRAR
ncbi:MAG TPA: glycosyltransferase, partial [Rugosimonospora sp.]|nr:glycosyltransferase [Rugosimonospora sp.]